MALIAAIVCEELSDVPAFASNMQRFVIARTWMSYWWVVGVELAGKRREWKKNNNYFAQNSHFKDTRDHAKH